jgi:hypothetical protein
VLLGILGERILDKRFLRLIEQMLKAGYIEDWEWNSTLSGAPQGGVLSPLLSNIYMDRLDKFAETVLIPGSTRGKTRRKNPAYREVENALKKNVQRRAGRKEHIETTGIRKLRGYLRSIPAGDPMDPGYRRLHYIRYADDHLLGFAGPKAEAEQVKQRLAAFLRDELRLELNQEKTLITHARTGAARFLGYEITVQHADNKISRGGRINRGMRATNGKVGLRVPLDVIKAKCAPYMQRGKPAHLDFLRSFSDYDIVTIYGAQYRGIVQYYLPAGDVWRLDRLKGVMLTSMLKTLAARHDSTVTKMADKHKATIATPHGPRRCFEARIERPGRKPLVARFGGIPLKRQRKAAVTDYPTDPIVPRRPGSQLLARLRQRQCEACGKPGQVEVHQVRKIADLAPQEGRPQAEWAQLMARMRRKTLIVCLACHQLIHAGKPAANSRINH